MWTLCLIITVLIFIQIPGFTTDMGNWEYGSRILKFSSLVINEHFCPSLKAFGVTSLTLFLLGLHPYFNCFASKLGRGQARVLEKGKI
jgi:hypothetical protein